MRSGLAANDDDPFSPGNEYNLDKALTGSRRFMPTR